MAVALLVLHSGALAIVLIVPLSGWLRVGLAVLIAAGLCRSLWQHALRRAPRAIKAVALTDEGSWMLELRAADTVGPCRLLAHYAHPWLVLAHLRCPDQRFPVSLVVAADAVERDGFRSLRARLNTDGRTLREHR